MAVRKSKMWVYWLLIGLLLVGLGGWFTGGAGGRASSIGSVGDLEISAQSYANALRDQMRRMSEQTGQAMTYEQAQALGIDRAVLSQIVTERVLDAEAARLGLSVGDDRVAEAVRGTPAFQGLDGEFDRTQYREQLRRIGLNESTFEQTLRDDSTRTILQAAVLGGVPEPETYAETLTAYANERRSVTWAPIGLDAVAIRPQATEEELRAWYDANPEDFTAPETRQISYAWLTPEMIQDGLTVEEDEVRALYDERIDEYVQEERRLVERLVFGTEAEAQEAIARIESGEVSFEDLVEERGLLLSDTDLGDVSRRELDEAADGVFAADPGDVVGPVSTNLGPALFRVNAVLAADEVPFEEAAPDLRSEIANERARDVIGDVIPQIEDLIAGGASVEDLDERTDLEGGEIAWSEDVAEGPAAYQEFREAAAAAQEGAFPELIELADGGVAVLRLDGVTPSALRPFDEVREEVEAAWEAQAITDAVIDRAEARAEAIAQGASFEDQGLDPRTEPRLMRRGAIEGTPPEFVATAFEMEPGEVRALPGGDGAVILRVDGVEPAPENDPAVIAERAAFAARVSESMAQDLYEAYARQLQVNTEIRINDQAVAAVNAQLN